MSKGKIVFIVEGNKFEPNILNILCDRFKLFGEELEILILPTCTNIYCLYKDLKLDDGLDMIEVAKDRLKSLNTFEASNILNNFNNINRTCVSELYLLYDLDAHANNLPAGMDLKTYVDELIDFFDNESEFGKLYISYPMAESLKWFSKKSICVDQCSFDINDGTNFKHKASTLSCINDLSRTTMEDLYFIIHLFLHKSACLMSKDSSFSIRDFKAQCSTYHIFDAQRNKYMDKSNEVMILSAIPQFLIEYFKEEEIVAFFGKNFLQSKLKCI